MPKSRLRKNHKQKVKKIKKWEKKQKLIEQK